MLIWLWFKSVLWAVYEVFFSNIGVTFIIGIARAWANHAQSDKTSG